MAETEAIRSGINDTNVKSRANTSTAKTMAVIGALKIADIAPAEAAPSNRILVLAFMWNILAMFDPIADPVATVGPSSPTEPPKPTVSGAVMIEPHIWKRLITPLRLEIAYSVDGIPCPTGSLIMNLITRYVRNIPISGNTK